jgi:hypothetical protein
MGCRTAKGFTRPVRGSLGTIAVCGHHEHWWNPPERFYCAPSLSEALGLAYGLDVEQDPDLALGPVVAGGARLIEESLRHPSCVRVYHTSISSSAVVCRHKPDDRTYARRPESHQRWEIGSVSYASYLSVREWLPKRQPEDLAAVPAG